VTSVGDPVDPKIKLVATCVRVPVFICHSEAVNIEFEEPLTADEARDILRKAPGLVVIDKHEAGGYVTPYECAGEDATYPVSCPAKTVPAPGLGTPTPCSTAYCAKS
jgi:aspartate-semialdehyde dehydrogenase